MTPSRSSTHSRWFPSRLGQLTAIVAVTLSGCHEPDPARVPSSARRIEPASLAGHYRLVESITLEQPDSAPIVRISGIDRNSAGMIALGDASEGNVKLFSPGGKLLRIIGRKGEGPGEFREPRFPRFQDDSTLHVADSYNSRVTVFRTGGKLVRSLQLGRLVFLSGFALDGRGGYLGATEDPEGYVLHHFDSTGTRRRRFLRIRDVVPRGQASSPLWRHVRGFQLAARDDTAYVVLTYSDTLWSVSLLDGAEQAVAMTPPSYQVPAIPAQEPRDMAGLRAWSSSLQMATSVRAGGAGLVINFVKGILNYGDPNTAVVRTPDGAWIAVRTAPAFLLADRRGLVALASASDSTSAAVVLGLYEPRGRLHGSVK